MDNKQEKWDLRVTSTEVVLLMRRLVCIITKQRRLSAKAKFRTASMYKICKKEGHHENAELLHRYFSNYFGREELPKAKKVAARFPGDSEWCLACWKKLTKLGSSTSVSIVVSRNVYSYTKCSTYKSTEQTDNIEKCATLATKGTRTV